jgi:hypothetical protein
LSLATEQSTQTTLLLNGMARHQEGLQCTKSIKESRIHHQT